MRRVAVVVAGARRRLRCAARSGLVNPGDRRCRALLRLTGWAAAAAAVRVTLAMALTLAPSAVRPRCLVGRFRFRGAAGRGIHEGDREADQFLDRGDGFGIVAAADQRDRGAAPAGAAGAADTVHVIVGVERYVEIVDVADFGNV